jgi:hypothetical protein
VTTEVEIDQPVLAVDGKIAQAAVSHGQVDQM